MQATVAKHLEAGTHVTYEFRATWFSPQTPPPPRPGGTTPAELRLFKKRDRLAIVLHRLGGLADHDSLSPVAEEMPEKIKSKLDPLVLRHLWELRYPVHETSPDPLVAMLDPWRLPPEVAENMLDLVEKELRQVCPKEYAAVGPAPEGVQQAVTVPTDVRPTASMLEETGHIGHTTRAKLQREAGLPPLPRGRRGSKVRFSRQHVRRLLDAARRILSPRKLATVESGWAPFLAPERDGVSRADTSRSQSNHTSRNKPLSNPTSPKRT